MKHKNIERVKILAKTNKTTVIAKNWFVSKVFLWAWKRIIKIDMETNDGKLVFTITNANNL